MARLRRAVVGEVALRVARLGSRDVQRHVMGRALAACRVTHIHLLRLGCRHRQCNRQGDGKRPERRQQLVHFSNSLQPATLQAE